MTHDFTHELLPFIDEELEKQEKNEINTFEFRKTEDCINEYFNSSYITRSSTYDSQVATCFFPINSVQQESDTDNFKKRKGTATMHGQMYEVKMCALLFLKLINIGAEFHLCSNIEDGGDFDDIVMHYRYKNEHGEIISKAVFIQLKHAQNKNTTRSISFCEGYFDLNRYFLSFCTVNNTVDPKHKILCSKPCNREYLIFTNANVNTQDITGKCLLNKTNSFNEILSNVSVLGDVYSIQENEVREYQELISIIKEISVDNSSREYIDHVKKHIIEIHKNKNNSILQTLLSNVNKNESEFVKIVDKRKLMNTSNFKDFISQSRIYCNQLDENDLDAVIKSEIEKMVSHSPQETEKIYFKLLENVKFWWENESCYLTNKCSFWTDIVKNIEVFRFTQRENELLSLDINFREDILKEMQVKLCQDTSVLNVVCSGSSTTITSLKVLQSFRAKENRDYIVVLLKDFKNKSDIIFSTWPNRWCKTLIVEYIDSYKSNEWPTQRICEVLLTDLTARLILISTKQTKVMSCFSETNLQNEYKEILDISEVNQLDIISQNKVFVKEILFQGCLVQLTDILHQNEIRNIDSDILEYLLKSDPIYLGKDIQEYKIEKYIPRNIEIPTVDESIFSCDSTNIVLAIEVLNDDDINCLKFGKIITVKYVQTSLSVNGLTCVIMEQGSERENFKSLCKIFDNVHWIKKNGDTYIWKKGKGDISMIKSHLKSSSVCKRTFEEIFIKGELQSPVVITGEPGIGKSTILSQMAWSIKQQYPSKWVILINLSKHCESLSKIKDVTKENVFQIFKNSLILTNNDIYFFTLISKNLENFIVFLDAFDEISPLYTEKVKDIITYLTSSSYFVYVTSRPSYTPYIENMLCTISYNLMPLSEDSKHLFLCCMLATINPKLSEQETSKLSKNILEKFSSLCDEENTLTKNPLHLKMLAETFANSLQNEENIISSEISLNIFQIFTAYVRRKCETFFKDKKKTDIFNPNTKKELEEFIENFTEANKIISAGIYYGQNVEKSCNLMYSDDLFQNKYRITQSDLIKVGILSEISNHSINYIHRSFIEYFFALQMADTYRKNKKIVKEIFLDDKFQVVRHFFDLKCAEKCTFHTQIILSDKLCSQEFNVMRESLDTVGRRAVHLAAAYNRPEILRLLIKDIDDLFIEDSIGWTPVDYAIVSKYLESANAVLEKTDVLLKGRKNIFKSFTERIQVKRIKDKVHKSIRHKMESVVYTCCLEGLTHALACITKYVDLNKAFDFSDYMDSNIQNVMYFKYSQKIYPIHIAAYANNVNIVKKLIKCKCDINVTTFTNCYNQEFAYTSLHIASNEGNLDIVKVLIENGCAVNMKSANKETSLHLACRRGHADIVKILIKNGSNTESKEKYDQTPLHIACVNKHVDIVNMLLENGSNINVKDVSEKSPLHFASENGHAKIAKILIKYGSNVNDTDTYQKSPLHLASENGHFDVVRLLIRNGSNIETKDEYKQSPLHLASGNGHIDVVKILIENGCDIESKDDHCRSSLQLACRNGQTDVVKILIKNGSDIGTKDQYKQDPLHVACVYGYAEIVELLIENGSNIESEDDHYRSPLQLACENGHTDVVKVLIQNSSNLEDKKKFLYLEYQVPILKEFVSDMENKNEYKQVPLHLACVYGYIDIVKILIENGSDIESKDDHMRTPLHLASGCGNFDIVKLLIESGSNVGSRDHYEQIPLHAACGYGYFDIVNILIKYRSDVGSKDQYSQTPLHLACANGHTDLVQILIENGSDVESKDDYKRTPVLLASRNGHIEVVKILIQNGCDLESKDEYKQTALYFACGNGYFEIVKLLLEKGSDIESRDDHSRTSLQVACENGHADIVNILIENGSNVNSKDSNKQTPLHFACANGHVDVVKILIENGADIASKDDYKSTPLQLARTNEHINIVKVLTKKLQVSKEQRF